MGHRAGKKYNKNNADILEEVQYLTELCVGIEHDTSMNRRKLNQMEENTNLVMEKLYAISAAMEGVNKKQDKLMRTLWEVEHMQEMFVVELGRLEKSFTMAAVVSVISALAVIIALA